MGWILLWVLPLFIAGFFVRRAVKVDLHKYGKISIRDTKMYLGMMFVSIIPVFNWIVLIAVGIYFLFDEKEKYGEKFFTKFFRVIFLIRKPKVTNKEEK